MATISRPSDDEYAGYYHTYVGGVAEGDVLQHLGVQLERTLTLYRGLSAERLDYRYAAGKWSTKQVLGHVIDSERVFADRAMRFARGDETPLPGIDQDVLMAVAGFDERPLESMLDELEHLRAANIALFASFDKDTLDRRGVASEVSFTVRSLVYIVAGHLEHHLGVVQQRYLAAK